VNRPYGGNLGLCAKRERDGRPVPYISHSSLLTPHFSFPFLIPPSSLFCAVKTPKTQHLVASKFYENFLKKLQKTLDFFSVMLYSRRCASSEQGENMPQSRVCADCTICDEAGGCGSWSRFFRGVCPISNRAKEYCVQRKAVRLCAPAQRAE